VANESADLLGWVKAHRRMLNSWVFGKSKRLYLWMWCLLRAAYSPHWWRGEVQLEPGQFVFGRQRAADVLDLSVSEVRLLMSQFEKRNMIVRKRTSQYSIITIVNWETYQSNENENHQQTTSGPPAGHQRATTYKKDKKDKKNTCGDKPREPNPVWDAVCAEWGLSPDTKNDRTRIGEFTAGFTAKLKGADPSEIHRRRMAVRAQWKDGTDTPGSVLKHWDEFGGGGKPQSNKPRCPKCGSDPSVTMGLGPDGSSGPATKYKCPKCDDWWTANDIAALPGGK